MDQDKRQKIIDAALKVFARDGFHKAKVSDIAQEAQVAHGTVYLYFQSKDDLLVSVFREQMSEVLEYIESEVGKVSGTRERLRKLIDVQLELARENRHLAELILIELRQSIKFFKSNAIDVLGQYIDFIKKILDEGIASGEVRNDLDTDVIATMIYSSFDGMLTRWVLEEGSFDLGKVARSMYQMLLEGIINQNKED